MLISYLHNYIYIRPKKTGSTTIVDVLSASFGSEDLMGGHFGKSKMEENREHVPTKYEAHLDAKEISALTTPEFWTSAFKFASERHPYEKAVSLAYYNLNKPKNRHIQSDEEIADTIDRTVKKGKYRGYDMYTIDGKVVVDDFIRHENLDADLRRICARLGVPVPAELPRKKSNARKDPRPAKAILSDAQKQSIYEFCREEFELFGYER